MSSTELSDAQWRKSSRSNGQANCVEVAGLGGECPVAAVRDSKAPDTPSLIFTSRVWMEFMERVEATQKT